MNAHVVVVKEKTTFLCVGPGCDVSCGVRFIFGLMPVDNLGMTVPAEGYGVWRWEKKHELHLLDFQGSSLCLQETISLTLLRIPANTNVYVD